MTKTSQLAWGALVAAIAVVALWESNRGRQKGGNGESNSEPATQVTTQAAAWLTLTDAERHFHLDYPPSWKVNTEVIPVEHYSLVFAALNSAGKDGFTVREMQTAPDTWQLNADLIGWQVPAGTAYIDVFWQEGPPGPGDFGRFDPRTGEMDAADLSGPLKQSTEERQRTRTGDLISRNISFSKWGKEWNVTVFMHEPVTAALRDDVDKILASFHFDGVPDDDKAWAIGRALKSLPPEADPDKFTTEGRSDGYFCDTEVNGNDVIVTFTKSLPDTPAQSWKYRVNPKGDVGAMGS